MIFTPISPKGRGSPLPLPLPSDPKTTRPVNVLTPSEHFLAVQGRKKTPFFRTYFFIDFWVPHFLDFLHFLSPKWHQNRPQIDDFWSPNHMFFWSSFFHRFFHRFFCFLQLLCIFEFYKNMPRDLLFTVFSALPAFAEALSLDDLLLDFPS